MTLRRLGAKRNHPPYPHAKPYTQNPPAHLLFAPSQESLTNSDTHHQNHSRLNPAITLRPTNALVHPRRVNCNAFEGAPRPLHLDPCRRFPRLLTWPLLWQACPYTLHQPRLRRASDHLTWLEETFTPDTPATATATAIMTSIQAAPNLPAALPADLSREQLHETMRVRDCACGLFVHH